MHFCTQYQIFVDLARLDEEAYVAELSRRYPDAARPHSHECPTCHRLITHTRLEALKEGDMQSHLCCGKDVRA